MLRYAKEWADYVTRQARWVDFDDDYKTLDPRYMESVIWVFRQLYDKGLIYEGNKVVPYCTRCQTPLSNFERASTTRLRRAPGSGAHGPVQAGERTSRSWLDHDAVDLAVERRVRRRWADRLRAWRRTATTSGWPRGCWPPTSGSWPATSSRSGDRRVAGRPALLAALRLLRRISSNAGRVSGHPGRRLRHHRGRHRDRPHGARFGEDDALCNANGIAGPNPVAEPAPSIRGEGFPRAACIRRQSAHRRN